MLALESVAVKQAELTQHAAIEVYGEERVEAVRSLIQHANTDLIAGCELSRGGYFKQAYALWRAWYEQIFLALYFIETPLHLSAWRRVSKIEFGKEPPYKLMLHEVLKKGGDKPHPFAVVYGERFSSLFRALRIDVPGKYRPLDAATERLADLSQGVHGTFQPTAVKSQAELPTALAQHVHPLFEPTVTLVGLFCFVCIQSQLDFSDDQIVRMKDRGFQPTPEYPEESIIAPLLPQLWNWLETLRSENRGRSVASTASR